mmetsp:Transcript_47552/g.74269  ORF Transcript_47552/g.74269 Transcript_47552/m.74269 type:complete len:202 (+) Transcript_47552:271-876(+)|eukprot:CAMPEP_0184309204 /NCGR_PEP_ID=MMETSP1049-20130417/17446_1 /TAXON_ID=77928 /ORGANISM="Proteomonas sulcata, Strain CCMP704" /LENGTH=201 /DNA_ID=CAMNT_0026622053 /DNA_START=232 /DNA_END=837 /DNA_ORIENTATION=+
MAGTWKNTANRGFYYGPSSNNAWNNDVGWKHAIARENRLASKFVEAQMAADGMPPVAANGKKDDLSSVGGKSVYSSASRDTLYRHFEKLTKDEQMAVLKDALNRKQRIDAMDSASSKFDLNELNGLPSQDKADKLLHALGNERDSRKKKEALFEDLLREERSARQQAESAMKTLETKLDSLAQVMGVPAKQNYLKRTSKKV